jgi:hypothetical protein
MNIKQVKENIGRRLLVFVFRFFAAWYAFTKPYASVFYTNKSGGYVNYISVAKEDKKRFLKDIQSTLNKVLED